MKKILKRTAAWTVALLVMVFSGAAAYADTYHGLRDDEIELILPDSWECDEISTGTSEGEPYELIAETYDDSGKTLLSMDLYYMHDSIGEQENYGMSEKASAMEYFDLYGGITLETLLSELEWIESAAIGEPLYFSGEFTSMLEIPIEGVDIYGDDFSDTVYMDCVKNYDNQTMVHRILLFYNTDGSPLDEGEKKTAEYISDNFYDYGYYDDGYFNGGSDFSEIFDILLMALPLVIAIPGIIAAGVKKLSGLLGEKPAGSKKPAGTKKTKPAPIPAGSSSTRKAMSSEERYMESLRTLRKSGLLTKEEMADMLARHERNRSKRRRN